MQINTKEVQKILTKVKDLCSATLPDWKVKVRVLNKSAVKEHARGKLFKVDFVDTLDDKTSIEAMFYTEETDLFFKRIQEGSTYFVSDAEIAVANKRLTTIPHDFRLIFKPHTLIEEFEQTPDGTKQKKMIMNAVNYSSISEIQKEESGKVVNLIGYVVHDPQLDEEITVKHHDTQSFKGRIFVKLSDGNDSIQVNLWGEELVGLKIVKDDTLLVMGARISDKFGALQLNVNSKDGKVTVNPKGYKQLQKSLNKPSTTLIQQLSEKSQ